MITAIAIDDEPPALRVIENFCKRNGQIQLVKTFTKPDEARRYLINFPVSLLFLDIQMPSVNGLDFYKSLPPGKMVIFTTAFSNYAVEGFNVNALDYLLKPFTYERFESAVQKACDYYLYQNRDGNTPNPHFFIRADYSLIKVNFSDIEYIEGLDDYLKIHLTNRSPIVARMTLKNIMEKLPEKDFCRVHRSFIVPMQKIEAVKGKAIKLSHVEIPIGSSYEADFFSRNH